MVDDCEANDNWKSRGESKEDRSAHKKRQTSLSMLICIAEKEKRPRESGALMCWHDGCVG